MSLIVLSLRWIARSRPGRIVCTLLVLAAAPVAAPATDAADRDPPARSTKLFDPTDGWLDISEFLDTAYGFVPVVSPITEPAVGYGAMAALVFVDRTEPVEGQSYSRPNLAVLAGMATENGSRGLFAAHFGNWKEGRLRTLVGLMDTEIHLEFFGLGGERPQDERGLGYTINGRGGGAGGSYRFGDQPLWVGLRYANMRTSIEVSEENSSGSTAIPDTDRELDLVALTPSLTFDTRDNLFTPTRGWYLDLSVPVFRAALGGDRDFERATLTGLAFRPLTDSLFFGARSSVRASSDGTPFFLRPYVVLRGVEAFRYQGEQTAELETELRWQFHRRFSLVGFGGAGFARRDAEEGRRQRSVATGGAGLRYLVARGHGMHMGVDLAFGPDDPIVYVVFGSAWMRP